MAIALLPNSGVAASAATGPTSISPALTTASKQGNCLVLAVLVTGTTAVSITTPANWTFLANGAQGTVFLLDLFIFPNNPGGITSVTVTVTATVGNAAAAIFEFSGTGPMTQEKVQGFAQLAITSYGNQMNPYVPYGNELLFYVAGFNPATLTPANSAEWSSAVGTVVSTGGAPNAQLACFWGNPPASIPNSVIGGSLSASVNAGVVELRFVNGTIPALVQDNINGQSGIFVPSFYQGQIGG